MPKTKHPNFSREGTPAFWITCDICEDSQLFYGQLRKNEADDWMYHHRKDGCYA